MIGVTHGVIAITSQKITDTRWDQKTTIILDFLNPLAHAVNAGFVRSNLQIW